MHCDRIGANTESIRIITPPITLNRCLTNGACLRNNYWLPNSTFHQFRIHTPAPIPLPGPVTKRSIACCWFRCGIAERMRCTMSGSMSMRSGLGAAMARREGGPAQGHHSREKQTTTRCRGGHTHRETGNTKTGGEGT